MRAYLCYLVDGPDHGSIVMKQREEYRLQVAHNSSGHYRTGTYQRMGGFPDADSGEPYKIVYVWIGWEK